MGRPEAEADLRGELLRVLDLPEDLVQVVWEGNSPRVTVAARAYLLYGTRRVHEIADAMPAIVDRVLRRHIRGTSDLSDAEFAEHMRAKRQRNA